MGGARDLCRFGRGRRHLSRCGDAGSALTSAAANRRATGGVAPVSGRDCRCGDAGPARTSATAEHRENPQYLEETIEAVRVTQRERVQQRAVDAPMP